MLSCAVVHVHEPTRFGRYELLAELGRGGMAELFLGRLGGRGGFSKLVAIKRILPHLSRDARFVDMFLNEGRIAARLAHPNVCQVYELGEVDGELFLVMEYLEGAALGELAPAIPRDPATMLRVAACVIGQACDGLRYAHELRDALGQPTPVVHRDVSPHNLFVTTDGICKLLDFGVSKVVSDADQTKGGLIKGKLPYMPPEQIRGEPIDTRADVFSAGVVLWETLTGERLFLRASDFLIWQAIMEEPVPPVSSYHAVYGDALDALLARALARDRAERTPSIARFADELREAAAAVGGPASSAEVAELVRRSCAGKLADRSRQIAALGFVRPADKDEPVIPAAEPSVTRSVGLRERSVGIERRRRRWPAALGARSRARRAPARWRWRCAAAGARPRRTPRSARRPTPRSPRSPHRPTPRAPRSPASPTRASPTTSSSIPSPRSPRPDRPRGRGLPRSRATSASTRRRTRRSTSTASASIRPRSTSARSARAATPCARCCPTAASARSRSGSSPAGM